MKICMICEGSYPYVMGGVSSWVDMLIRSMPEHDFLLYCIGAEERQRGDFRYAIPPNVLSVREVFLDAVFRKSGTFNRRICIPAEQKRNIEALITGGDADFASLSEALRAMRLENIADFFMCEAFFEIVVQAYRQRYAALPFTDFFWAVRSMLLPLFFILTDTPPEADLYHSVSTGYAGVAGSVAAARLHRPLLLTEHGIYTREREEEIIKARWVRDYLKDLWIHFYYTLSRGTYRSAARVVTLFEKNRAIETELGCPAEKISVVSNGIDTDAFARIPDETDPKALRIGAVLRVVPIKDVKTMLQSFANVSAELPGCEFYILGPTEEDPAYYAECLELCRELRLQNVNFTGAVDVRRYLGKMDLLVLSSISEGQPLAVLEGLACRRPFVATNVGSCAELLYGGGDNFGRAGIVVPLMDAVRLSEAILRLCRDPQLRRRMGENGFRRVSALYTQERMIRSYQKIYRECGRC